MSRDDCLDQLGLYRLVQMTKYHLSIPFPIKHTGLFQARFDLIGKLKSDYQGQSDFSFRQTLPKADQVHQYFQILGKNSHSNEYFGQLLGDQDSWKFLSAVADLDNFYSGFEKILEEEISYAYFFTNTGGHHADNTRYELFCPLNQLFFIVEFLNYRANFPKIAWIDLDAHFGNGDKKLFDSYRQKMSREGSNLKGVSFHNDYGQINEPDYLGVSYDPEVSQDQFLTLISHSLNSQVFDQVRYLLLFFGTDIFLDDYGGNKRITPAVLPELVSIFEKLCQKTGSKIIVIQAGGQNKENLLNLINHLVSQQDGSTNK